jgi:YfiH family protein
VAAVHAGWRGLAAGVIESAVAGMRGHGAADDELLAWLGPAIGPDAFEVGTDVRDAFMAYSPMSSSAFIGGAAGKWWCDLRQLARQRLAACAVRRVASADQCTVSDRQFFSYRRDGVTGRMAGLIWMVPGVA